MPLDVKAETNIKTKNESCIRRLITLNIEPGPKVYPKPNEPSQIGTEISVQTNIFGLELVKSIEIFPYIVNIKSDITPTKTVYFTKKGKEDFVVVDRHEKSCEIFFHSVQKFKEFFKFPEQSILVYDGQSLLFSTHNLFSNSTEKKKTLEIEGSDTRLRELQSLKTIQIEIYPSKNPSFILSKHNLCQRTANSDLSANNRAYYQFLELSLNQHCIRNTLKSVCFENGKLFFVSPLREGFIEDDCVRVGDGKHMLPGLKKCVQFIEGPNGRGHNNPSIVIDAMKVAFHTEQLVLDKLCEILQKTPENGLQQVDRERCISVVKGLDCHSSYTGRVRHLRIEGIHHLGADSARFQLKEGDTCSVAQYFEQKYNIRLRYPRLNLLICKERGHQNFYPMELMTITGKQRVKISQQTSQQSKKTTKESAVLPHVRQRLIMTGKNAAEISSKNGIISELGVLVCEEPLLTKGRQMPPTNIAFFDKIIQAGSGKWRFSNYSRPAEAPNIWAMYAVGTDSTKFSMDILKRFQSLFVNACQMKGIRIGAPADLQMISMKHIEEQLLSAAKNNCTFVLTITDDSISNLHQKFKMIERNCQMIVQDMKISNALSIVNQGRKLTLENVINKTNIKLGGLNYTVTDEHRYLVTPLIIGIGFSNPPPSSKYLLETEGTLNPMIVGFTSNGKGPQEFIGDFLLCQPGQESIASIEDIISHSLNSYKQHRKKLPKKIIVYRSGASEGSHGSIMSFEIPLARAAMNRESAEIKLIYIMVTKDHTFRFFKENLDGAESASVMSSSSSSVLSSRSGSRSSTSSIMKAETSNIGPGILLDSGVTHPACKQFFLNSHSTLQGTAKTPLYSILADDCEAKLSILEDITYSLCHTHQIVGLSTSLPTPLYVAIQYAKRGRDLFLEKCSQMQLLTTSGSDCFGKMTDEINYRKTGELSERRINA